MMDGMTLTNEGRLVEQAAISPAAFAAIYDHYFPKVFTYVRYRVESDSAADDVTAHIFEQALTRIDQYDPRIAPFGAWLFGIARYAVGNHRRSLARFLPLDLLKQRPAGFDSPEESAIQSESEERLLAAVSKLNDRERDLIGLKFAGGMNNRQIATVTGLSESNVGVTLHRALKSLRAVLEQEGRDV